MPERKPPYDLNAEAAVISAILCEPDCVPKVIAKLSPADFYDAKNKVIFETLRGLFNVQSPIDLILLIERLKTSGKFNNAGKLDYLNKISNAVVSAANVDEHIGLVLKYSQYRAALKQAEALANDLYKIAPLEVASQHVDALRAIIAQSDESSTLVSKIINQSWENMVNCWDGKFVPNIKIGWSMHDKVLGGLGPGQLIIVGARPGMGKTQYAINIARNIGRLGRSVYFKSYEMGKLEVTERLIIMNSYGESSFSEEKHKPSSEEVIDYITNVYDKSMIEMEQVIINIDDLSGDGTSKLHSRLAQFKQNIGLDLAIVDYIGLIPKSKEQMKALDPLGQITRELKLMAKELQIPIIALAQLNRETEKRTNKIPQLNNLRESGSIEQDADVVIFLHREDYYNPEADSAGEMQAIIAKNRHGSPGKVQLLYNRRTGLIAEIDVMSTLGFVTPMKFEPTVDSSKVITG